MNKFSRTILLAMLFWAISVPFGWARTDGVASGRDLLKTPCKKDKRGRELLNKEDCTKALQLLDKYRETQNKLQSFIAKYVNTYSSTDTTNPGRRLGRQVGEIRIDSDQVHCRANIWSKLATEDEPTPIENAHYKSFLWDGKSFFEYRRGETDYAVAFIFSHNKPAMRAVSYLGAPLSGVYYGDLESVDSILRQASSISLPNEPTYVGDSKCYVIDAVTKHGKYSVWIDPEHGYNIAKAEVRKERNDVAWGRPLHLEGRRSSIKALSFSLKNVRFEKIDRVWVPVEADYQFTKTYEDGLIVKVNRHHKRTSFELNPDFEAVGAFVPDIADGTKVYVIGLEGEYVWSGQRGGVVDHRGFPVSLDPNQPCPPVLVGKALPTFAGIETEFSTEQVKDKKVLVCFWDMNQRPSRYVAKELAKRVLKLKEKGVVVVCIQASKVDEKTLNEWLKNNSIRFPDGMIKGDEEKVRFAWGIKSLPWLILTDVNHVVAAEGFRIEELARNILQKMQPQQLLNEYQRSLSAFTQVCAIDAESLFVKDDGTKQTRYLMRYEYRRDNGRVDVNNTQYRLNDKGERIEESPWWRTRAICDSDGNAILYYGRGAVPEDVEYTFDGARKFGFTMAQMGTCLSLDGYLARDQVSVIELLSNSPDLHLREAKDNVDGFECYVLEGSTDHGRYTLWLDPEYGYLPRKAKVEKENRHIWGGKPLTEVDWLSGISFTMNSVRIEKRQGIFVPVESKNTEVWRKSDGTTSTHIHNHKRTRIDLRPDFRALNAFVPDIPDGTEVGVELGVNDELMKCLWKNGKVVDSEGRDVALTLKRPPSLVGKSLPQFDGLDVEFEVENARGNKSLICFWDMNQRPSRYLVMELAKRAEELKEKGVAVVCVQASEVDKNQLDNWVKKYNIPFAVGMIQADEEKVRFAWGVKALPWLILTDREHVVTAEGFGLEELIEHMKQAADAKK